MGETHLRKPTILAINLGYLHEDYMAVQEYLQAVKVIRIQANIFQESEREYAFQMIHRQKIDLIETRNLRRGQEFWKTLAPILDSIEQVAKTRGIPMINSPTMIRWVFNKGSYLKELESYGIPIVPTKVIGEHDEVCFSALVKAYKNGITIKPSLAAKAYGLQFVKSINHNLFEIKIPHGKTKQQEAFCETKILSAGELQDYFEKYRQNLAQYSLYKDQLIIIQKFIEKQTEYSAIKIRGYPTYFVQRLVGEKTGVAHEHFLGKNIFIQIPEPPLLDFYQKFQQRLPSSLKNEIIWRIDMFKCPKQILLLEVETASPRLFNTKLLANNIHEYSNTIATAAKNSYIYYLNNGHHQGTADDDLVPTADILPHFSHIDYAN